MNRKLSLISRSALSLTLLAGLAGCGKKDRSENADFGYRQETAAPRETPRTSEVRVETLDPVTAVTPAAHPQATYEEAEAAFQNRRYEEAATLFASYAESRPENPWGHYMLGLSSWKTGRLAAAESAFTRALELDPKHGKSLLNLSRVLLEAGRPRDARPLLETAIALDGDNAEAYRLVGRMEFALGRGPEAETAYHRALALDENDVWSMNNLGLLCIQARRFDEALLPLVRATELRPTSPVFHNNLGIALEGLGQVEEARRAFGVAVDQDPAYAKAAENLRRVEGLTENPSMGEVDLAACVLAFAEHVRTWRREAELTSVPAAEVPDSSLVHLETATPEN